VQPVCDACQLGQVGSEALRVAELETCQCTVLMALGGALEIAGLERHLDLLGREPGLPTGEGRSVLCRDVAREHVRERRRIARAAREP
jgi:hypothetical protein